MYRCYLFHLNMHFCALSQLQRIMREIKYKKRKNNQQQQQQQRNTERSHVIASNESANNKSNNITNRKLCRYKKTFSTFSIYAIAQYFCCAFAAFY